MAGEAGVVTSVSGAGRLCPPRGRARCGNGVTARRQLYMAVCCLQPACFGPAVWRGPTVPEAPLSCLRAPSSPVPRLRGRPGRLRLDSSKPEKMSKARPRLEGASLGVAGGARLQHGPSRSPQAPFRVQAVSNQRTLKFPLFPPFKWKTQAAAALAVSCRHHHCPNLGLPPSGSPQGTGHPAVLLAVQSALCPWAEAFCLCHRRTGIVSFH